MWEEKKVIFHEKWNQNNCLSKTFLLQASRKKPEQFQIYRIEIVQVTLEKIMQPLKQTTWPKKRQALWYSSMAWLCRRHVTDGKQIWSETATRMCVRSCICACACAFILYILYCQLKIETFSF